MLFFSNICQKWLKSQLMLGMLRVIATGIILLTGILLPWTGFAQAENIPEVECIKSQILINNVRLLGYKSQSSDSPLFDNLTPQMNVLIVNKKIREISESSLEFQEPPTSQPEDFENTCPGYFTEQKTINATDGLVLMPGLIDAHYHIMLATFEGDPSTAEIGYINQVAAKNAKDILMRGFTTVRDMGGPSFGLKRAIDEGIIVGPRIFPSGAFISQTGGHGDFRLLTDVPKAPGAPLTYSEQVGLAAIADSPDEVRLRAREQLRQGATQLKLMAGGGVSSSYDPIDVTQYTKDELVAAVQAAENWGTYVTVHAYTAKAIQQAVEAGVKSIEHGQLVAEGCGEDIEDCAAKTVLSMMRDKGIWWSLQPFLLDEDANPKKGEKLEKQKQVSEGTKTAYRLAKHYKIKTAFGTDVLFASKIAARQGKQLTKLVHDLEYSPAEAIKMATADNGELMALSGPRNPYGELGVIKEGALADLLLVQGNPLDNIDIIKNPTENFVVIIKDGKIYKAIQFS